MFGYLLKRLIQMTLVLWVVSVIVFLMMSFTGDPVFMVVPIDATDAEIAQARRLLGLDQSLLVQYGKFLTSLVQGDFGNSYVFRQPAMTLILERMPATVEMVLVAMALAIAVAIPLGVYAGANPNSRISRVIMAGSLLGISLPGFWVGMVLIYLFAVHWGVFPSSGRGDTAELFGLRISLLTWDGWHHIMLPAITLSLGTMAILLRMTRAGMMEVGRQDFMKFARAKGATRRDVLYKHGLKNALIPVVTIFGLQLGDLIAFATITETIFSWPGMGKLLIDSIYRADRPVIVVYLMLVALIFVVINFIVDIVYTMIDPRITLK
ncbi:ABC transporter permease [Sulfitobacter mediterraneus]|jgi:peptide/nickel transport system permease protein|uniref:ABC transporter permease n=1 Tax=Sulfitobacter mediterraneus TaxID=83219 RepID=UPI001931D379|nr:ABC transporter permease [Sulfitobacter mediterraneus]MBM1634547.1 ABC transporter permease [Sulfitobacter mediterraneus]MBM1642365.1 ABC transporter permease [Sulfitobacter mediterraneus]MBM1646413.1 ABC transporter permease [Sulfitobacter mediterraneus]MBM1650459.1 ABC transporter permease [Sulfitobacter mediterraneus]MBM1654481.1 ABC transporter permease [Sulfitobacter mediterraneus]